MAIDKDDFIYIPEAKLWFAKERTHLSKDFDETHEALKKESSEMPTIEEFRLTLKYMRDSKEREHNVLYKEITQIKPTWRGNRLDALFEQRPDGIYLLTKNRTKEEKLEDCLMQNKVPGISLDDWIDGKNVTSQGFPSSNVKSGNLNYWAPVAGRVARCDANSDWAGLYCYGDPSGRNAGLGVFAVSHVSSEEKLENKPEIKFPSTYKNPFEIDLPRIDKIENLVYGGKE